MIERAREIFGGHAEAGARRRSLELRSTEPTRPGPSPTASRTQSTRPTASGSIDDEGDRGRRARY